ncbi:MAG TPA: hypothetical protein PLI97_01870 [Fluviicola sp.]|nr:hypothetical protein [Fluviicola sp.]
MKLETTHKLMFVLILIILSVMVYQIVSVNQTNLFEKEQVSLVDEIQEIEDHTLECDDLLKELKYLKNRVFNHSQSVANLGLIYTSYKTPLKSIILDVVIPPPRQCA